MKKYAAILSIPYETHRGAKDHIARSVENGISRYKLFTLHILSYDKKSYVYRICRVVTSGDISDTNYCEESKDQWEKHLKTQTNRVRKWLKRKTTKVIEKNKQTLALLDDL